MGPRLLVVDDEARQMEALCRTLTPEGYDVTGFSVPEHALAALQAQPFDVLLTDLMMPGMDGLALLRAALQIDPDLVGVMMTGQGTVASAVDAMKIGALDYILKPFNLSAIRPVLARAVDVRRLRLDNIRLREAVSLYEVSNAIARSLDSDAVLARVADAALEQSRADSVGVYVAAASASDLRLVAARGKATACPEVLSMDRVLEGGPFDGAAAPSVWRHPIPMMVDGRLVGALLCGVSTPRRPMTSGQIKGLSLLAGTAATALEASMLLEHLRRTNDDLRKFAWAASHDLQEPLRDVVLHTQLLARRQAALDAESGALANAAAAGARRILLLVQELRTFVDAGQVVPDGVESADSNAALERALADLQSAIADTQARIARVDLPPVRMRETDLAEVFRRLLDNAIKFRRPGSVPRIEIGAARDNNGHWVLSVADAGIGIDPGDHAQIFELFQRLNRREEYDGIGMGLPVCRRLVEAYGGRLWVESRAGEGARFFVSVPATRGAPSVLRVELTPAQDHVGPSAAHDWKP
jgi:signal transduction histidine kinase